MLKRALICACVIFAMLGFTAPPVQAQDDPLRGSTVSIRNTLERDDEGEEPVGEPDTATIGALIEFFPYGPYNIDVSSTEITFAWDSDPRWDDFERVLEADFFDRYYIDLEGVMITGAEADSSANLVPMVTVLDDDSLVVEFSEGMKVSDGQIARISLKVVSADAAAESEESESTESTDETEAEGTESAEESGESESTEEPAPAEETPAEETQEEPKEETASSESLPRTGPDAEAFGAGAIGLLTLGGALVVARRRAARQALSL